jgi:hypothetical protein
VAAIPYNSGTHVKYFARGKEVYDQYYGYLIRIYDLFFSVSVSLYLLNIHTGFVSARG